MKKLRSVLELEKLRKSIIEKNNKFEKIVTVCGGPGCSTCGSETIKKRFLLELQKNNLTKKVKLVYSGCHGFCEQGPIVVIRPNGIFYPKITPENVADIVSETIAGDRVIPELLYEDPVTGKRIVYEKDIAFYKAQNRTLIAQNELLDPSVIEDYIFNNGYKALPNVLTKMKPECVVDEIKHSGLRGRGGGGFPTGLKWENCRKAEGDTKYVICNCDEGDPGAFMDRALLEGNPHLVLEGMVIGAYAIGSQEGYIYVRHEYPQALENAAAAINQARKMGLLGKNILGTDFSFDIEIASGGGAFVCGESTALMASLEGKTGEPRDKQHLHTVQNGLWNRPTDLNNVETWANVPIIINKGSDWYSKIGTANSKGTKIFSLVGKIKNTGLIEVPMGTTLKEIIYDIGGGIPDGKDFKAVQTGGPSGGCIPKELLNLPVDFDSLTEAGSMMGSGGMIVMDESTCMVDVARYFLKFLMGESCGKCLPCREGLKRMYEIVTDIVEGKANGESIELLEELAEVVKEASLCALGKTAPNSVLSTLRYFRGEYEAHVKEKKCPAGVCTALISYNINEEVCTGCGACIKVCPHEAISGEKKKPHRINQDMCTKCGSCINVCKFGAIEVR